VSALLGAAAVSTGFLSSDVVRTALVAGAVTALVTGAVGTFTVMRGHAFAGHATGEVASSGGSAALLGGLSPLWGYLGIAVIVAGAIELLGAQRPRARDLATGLVLGAGLGVAALFLYLDTVSGSDNSPTISILFGSLFAVSAATLPAVIGLGALALAIVLAAHRMLLLSSLSADLAATRGVPVRLVSLAYLVALAVAVSLAAETVGAVLATALLVGPAATSLRLTRRPGAAMAGAALVGLAATWLGTWLAYQSYYWPPRGTGWTPSFFIVALIVAAHLAGGALASRRRRREGGGEPAAAPRSAAA
jgi:zinc/manganese transport system permease protein